MKMIKDRAGLSTVTGKNQVTIPAIIARAAKLEPGSRLEWKMAERDGELRVRVLPGPTELLRQIRALGARYAGRSPDSAAALRRMRSDDEATRAAGLSATAETTRRGRRS
jgi:bifunctional DNA-binding transcriptional regulator/antitoxin component of YhaV-PrlF toxin-antitoxin module